MGISPLLIAQALKQPHLAAQLLPLLPSPKHIPYHLLVGGTAGAGPTHSLRPNNGSAAQVPPPAVQAGPLTPIEYPGRTYGLLQIREEELYPYPPAEAVPFPEPGNTGRTYGLLQIREEELFPSATRQFAQSAPPGIPTQPRLIERRAATPPEGVSPDELLTSLQPDNLPEPEQTPADAQSQAVQGTVRTLPEGMSYPVNNPFVTSEFGPRNPDIAGASQNHNGVDFRAPLNAPIFASQSGTILDVRYNDRAGDHILIQHDNGSLSTYSHTGAIAGIVAGARVLPGQQIGISNGTGILEGPHLHYVYRPGTVETPATMQTTPVDPLRYQFGRR